MQIHRSIAVCVLASALLGAVRIAAQSGLETATALSETMQSPDARLPDNRARVEPLLDHPLRDPSVCRGPDGWYYLTGTDGTPVLPEFGEVDFENNDGIRIWRSKDLKNWEFVTQALELGASDGFSIHGPQVWRNRLVNRSQADAPQSRGAYAPRIHYIGGTFYITYTLNGWGGGILKSESGQPEGPYVRWSRANVKYRAHQKEYSDQLVFQGGVLSLFEDDNPPSQDGSGEAGGAVYAIYGDGLIARMTEDLGSLAEPPRPLLSLNAAKTGENAADYPLKVGAGGFFMKKIDGRYFLFASDFTPRASESVEDVYVAWADNPYGPFTERRWSIPYCGPTTVFEGPEGELLATYCGNDPHAAFRDRAGIVPLGMTRSDFPTIFPPEDSFPRKLIRINTTRYLFDRLPAVSPYQMRDTQATLGPDGALYYTGSHVTKQTDGKFYIYRSEDMINWEAIEVWDWDRQIPHFEKAVPDPRESKRNNVFSYMDSEIWYLGDTFYIGFSVYGASPAGYLLRSTTGKAEGPYEMHATNIPAQPSFFEDEDGSIFSATNGKIRAWKRDMTGPEPGAPTIQWQAADGSILIGDAAGQVVKEGPWYIHGTTGWAQEKYFQASWSAPDSYSWNVSFAKSLDGPWTREQSLLYMGHGGLVKDRHGNWWACFFGCERNQNMPWGSQTPGIHPLILTMVDGQPHFELAEELPDYAEQALRVRNQ